MREGAPVRRLASRRSLSDPDSRGPRERAIRDRSSPAATRSAWSSAQHCEARGGYIVLSIVRSAGQTLRRAPPAASETRDGDRAAPAGACRRTGRTSGSRRTASRCGSSSLAGGSCPWRASRSRRRSRSCPPRASFSDACRGKGDPRVELLAAHGGPCRPRSSRPRRPAPAPGARRSTTLRVPGTLDLQSGSLQLTDCAASRRARRAGAPRRRRRTSHVPRCRSTAPFTVAAPARGERAAATEAEVPAQRRLLIAQAAQVALVARQQHPALDVVEPPGCRAREGDADRRRRRAPLRRRTRS